MESNEPTPFDIIQSVFPNIKKEVIDKILDKNYFDLLVSLYYLTKLQSEDFEYFDNEDSIVNSISSNERIKNICVYDLQGICQKGNTCEYQHTNNLPVKINCKFVLKSCKLINCPYRHTPETMICKHWFYSNCKNSRCPFTHNLEKSFILLEEELKKENKNNIATPSLSISNNSNNNNNNTNISSKEDFPSLKQPKEDFPSLGQIKRSTNNKNNIIDSKRKNKNSNSINNNSINNNNINNSINNNNNNNIELNNNTQTHYIFIDESQEEFPTLGNYSKKQKSKLSRYPIESPDYIKLEMLKNEFTNVKEMDINKEFFKNKFGYEETYNNLVNKYGLPPKLPSKDLNSIENNNNNNNNNNNDNNIESTFNFSNNNNSGTAFDKSRLWVDTGMDVTLLYQKNRSQAIEYARERNRLFNQAARSYGADPIESYESSKRAKEYDRLMKECNAKARDVIFSTRNKNYDPINNNVLDFHGLHVIEAIEILEQYLCYLPKIIVGTGHHSNTPSSRLPTKIKEYLNQKGYDYKDVSTDKRGGLLQIKLRSKK